MHRIYAVLDDLFFLVKIQDAAKQIGAALTTLGNVEAVRAKAEVPTLYLFDLNCKATQPIETILWLRQQPATQNTRIIGFHSHVQEELKRKALEAGCDHVYARSAMSDRMKDILAAEREN
jgi:CheY-like chemotaxis protein